MAKHHVRIPVIRCLIALLVAKHSIHGLVAFDVNKISETIRESLEQREDIPGLAVGVVKNGQVLLAQGYGVSNLQSERPVDENTLFGIASLTKSFTATLIVKLLDEKTSLTANSKVRELLGDKFQMPDNWRTSETTFADLLAHRTGMLPNQALRFDTNLTKENLLERLPLLTAPDQFRVKYIYNSLIYGLVSGISQKLGERKWEDLMTSHIFQPLGMDNSTFATVVDLTRDDVATPYLERGDDGQLQIADTNFIRIWAELGGSGSIFSTVNDMVHWMNFHLSGGKTPTGEVLLQKDPFEELHRTHFRITDKGINLPTFPAAFIENRYSLGLRKGYYRGYRMMSHSGSTFGYKTYMTLIPSEKIGIILLLNGEDDKYLYRVPLQVYLLDNALGFVPWLNLSTINSYPEPWKPKPHPSHPKKTFNVSIPLRHEATAYEGLYHNDAYGYMTVKYNSTFKTLVMSYGFGSWQLYVWPKKNVDRERFFARSMEPLRSYDVEPIYFVTHPQHDDVIVGVNASGFEHHLPPVFCRPDDNSACMEAIFKVQKYNVGKLCQTKNCTVKKDNNDGGGGNGNIDQPLSVTVLLLHSALLYSIIHSCVM